MRKILVLLLAVALSVCVAESAWAVRAQAIGNLVHKGVSGYDVTGYGATGDGATDDATAIGTAATEAAGGRLILPKGTYKISSNVSLDEDVQIHKGATISVDGGVTLTLTGTITAGHYQIFAGAGDVSITAPVSAILPEWFGNTAVSTFTDADATPSVAQGRFFKTANTGGTTITNFDDGITGQVIRVIANDGNTTFDFTASNLIGNGGVDWTASTGNSMIAAYDGTNWYCDTLLSTGGLGTIDISDDTNLTVTAPITLTGDDVGITVAKDIVVAGTGMSGGENNVLPGADADTTITLTVAKDIVAGTGLTGGEDDVLPGA
ncbi:MAG: hypothetical protein ACYTAF_17120, partial [Planctomycetota bacterium]